MTPAVSRGAAAAPEDLAAVRDAAAALSPDDDHLAEWHRKYAGWHTDRLAADVTLLRRFAEPGAEVLDVGAVPPFFTFAATARGYRVTGCDLAPDRYADSIAAQGLPIVRCNVEREALPFADDRFDVVVASEIFEHLRIDLIHTVTEVLRVLRPGGTLILSTPNLRSLHGLRNFLLRDRATSCAENVYDEYAKLASIGHMGHVREYTPTEVREFLERVGFQVTEFVFRGDYPGAFDRTLLRLRPSLAPYVSVIATPSSL